MRTTGGLVLSAMLFTMLPGWGAARGEQPATAAHVAQAAPALNSLTPAVPASAVQTVPAVQKVNPLKRRLTDKDRIKQQKALKQELRGIYKTWLNQDVAYIITDTERKAFLQLSNDEERDQFIEAFWQRRNPDPGSADNTYRDEIYQRIQYANDHFAAGEPGWKTDRGHIYIVYGPPDDKDSHPSGGSYDRPMSEGGGTTDTYPFEVWHYRYIPGIGTNINMEFVDTCWCGDYHYTIDRSEKDALKHVPNAGLTLSEEEGITQKRDRYAGGIEQLGLSPGQQVKEQDEEFDRLDLEAKIMAPPPIQYADIDKFMTSATILNGPPLPFDVRTDYVKVTNDMVYVPITIQVHNSDMTFDTKDGVSTAKVDIEGRISNLTHKVAPGGWFGDPVEVSTPSELLPQIQKQSSVYWKEIPLRPGLYKIDVVVKDMNNPDHVGHQTFSIDVPRYNDDTLGHSSLILADKMERVPSKEIGGGNFVLGDTLVRPRVSSSPAIPVSFNRSQKLSFWMQVYNLGISSKSKHNDATIHYQVMDLTTKKAVLEAQESSDKLNPNGDELTLEKSFSLASLEPGLYQVSIQVDDGVTKQKTQDAAKFTVN